MHGRADCCASLPRPPAEVAAPYLDRVVDYEALSVQSNAPRWIKMLIKHNFMPAAT